MRIRFNPYRAGLFLVVALVILVWRKAAEFLPRSYPALHLDQRHMVAALAIAGITVVGVVRLILRRYR